MAHFIPLAGTSPGPNVSGGPRPQHLDKRQTRAITREIARAQESERCLKHTWASTPEEKQRLRTDGDIQISTCSRTTGMQNAALSSRTLYAREQPELMRLNNTTHGTTDFFGQDAAPSGRKACHAHDILEKNRARTIAFKNL